MSFIQMYTAARARGDALLRGERDHGEDATPGGDATEVARGEAGGRVPHQLADIWGGDCDASPLLSVSAADGGASPSE